MSQRRRAKSDDMLPEYDSTGAVRGKYYDRYRQGTNVVLLDPDVAAVFKEAKAPPRGVPKLTNRTSLTRRCIGRAKRRRAPERQPLGRSYVEGRILQYLSVSAGWGIILLTAGFLVF